MSEDLKNNIRLSKAAKEFNISPAMIVEFLGKKGHKVDSSPNTKLNGEMYALLVKEYQGEKEVKKNADQLGDFSYKGQSITIDSVKNDDANKDREDEEVTIRINGVTEDKPKKTSVEKPVEKKEVKPQVEVKTETKVETKVETIATPKAEATEVRHILPKMVRCAFKYGAKYGDCYGDFLANYYMKSGFIVIAKIPFDSLEDNPPNWDVEKDGKPYCYMMIRGVKNVAELDRLKKQNAIEGLDAVKSRLRTFKHIENAEKFRAELYNKIKIYGYKRRLEIIKSL